MFVEEKVAVWYDAASSDAKEKALHKTCVARRKYEQNSGAGCSAYGSALC
jgi:hypothetical protein